MAGRAAWRRVGRVTLHVGAALPLAAALLTGWHWSVAKAVEDQDAIRRGEYLVHRVAMCAECHTPRDAHGELIERQLLQGAPIPVIAPDALQPWAARSANLAALAQEDPARVLSVLQTGRRPDGTAPHNPMPSFRLSAEDAAAVVSYVRSLEP